MKMQLKSKQDDYKNVILVNRILSINSLKFVYRYFGKIISL